MNVLLVDSSFYNKYILKYIFQAILRLGGNSLKVECDDWYGRHLNAEQRHDGLKCIKGEKRLVLVEEELAEQGKELAGQSKELAEQSKGLAEQSKGLAETYKKPIELEQEKRNKLAEMNKKLIELEQEQSNPVHKNIRGKY